MARPDPLRPRTRRTAPCARTHLLWAYKICLAEIRTEGPGSCSFSRIPCTAMALSEGCLAERDTAAEGGGGGLRGGGRGGGGGGEGEGRARLH